MLILLIPSLWIQIAINRKAGKSCPRDKPVLSKQLEVRGLQNETHTDPLKGRCIEPTPSHGRALLHFYFAPALFALEVYSNTTTVTQIHICGETQACFTLCFLLQVFHPT